MKPIDAFNIELLILNKGITSRMGKVSSLTIFEQNTKNFNNDGLFSTTIFGQVGSSDRNERLGYIDMRIKVIHPLMYKHITSLSRVYKDILTGTGYGKWDNSIKDFVEATVEDGDTGYEFFLSKLKDIKFGPTKSDEREAKIKLLKMYSVDDILVDKWLVLPAGLRDYTVDDAGKPSEDEVNDLYRKLLTASNLLENINMNTVDMLSMNPTRHRIQMLTVAIYEHFISMMDGKKKFVQAKWISRNIANGTRNVITSLPIVIKNAGELNGAPSFNDTVVGLYQYGKAISDITKFEINDKFLSRIFTQTGTNATLVNAKTMKTVSVDIDPAIRDEWISDEGLEGIINKMSQESLRDEPIMVDGNYLILIYDDGKRIKPVYNTEEVPDNIDSKKFRPITYTELLYLSLVGTVGRYPGLLTRYPVIGLGGIYPTTIYLKTTIKGREVELLSDDWVTTTKLYEYPRLGEAHFNSMSPHYTKLGRLGGDYDGDKVSLTILVTEDSLDEINSLLNSREFYVAPGGDLAFSANTDDMDLVLASLTS